MGTIQICCQCLEGEDVVLWVDDVTDKSTACGGQCCGPASPGGRPQGNTRHVHEACYYLTHRHSDACSCE